MKVVALKPPSLLSGTNNLGEVLSEKILSQVSKHQKFGGVVPELASREHSNSICNLTKEVLIESRLSLEEINAFAATTGPGLLGGLLVGCNFAKGLSIMSHKPFLSVNHLQGHILVARMKQKIDYPFLCLLVSGGHSQMFVSNYNEIKILGETIDDAVGEVDKTAKLLDFVIQEGHILRS